MKSPIEKNGLRMIEPPLVSRYRSAADFDPENDERHLPVRNRGRMRGLMREALLFLPNLLKLAYRLSRDPRVSATDKVVLAATIVYVISPLDFVADFIPFFGQVDDIYLLAVSLLRLLHRTDAETLREHWDGDGDIQRMLNRIISLATFFLPGKVRGLLVGRAGAA
jgi:uncharacterized membrane protein YkvA (DUF1232 family)